MFDIRKQRDAHPRWGKAAWRYDPFLSVLKVAWHDTSTRNLLQYQRDAIEEHVGHDPGDDSIGEAANTQTLELRIGVQGRDYVLVSEWDYNEGDEGRNSIASIKPVNFKDTGQKITS